MSCVPLSSFLDSLFSSWMRANHGLISSALVSEGRATQDVSFVRLLARSKEANPYSSDLEDL
jgi:hypothetical protein